MIRSLFTIAILVYVLSVPGYAIILLFFKNVREKYCLSFRILAAAFFSLSFLYLFAFVLSILPFSQGAKRITVLVVLAMPLLVLWKVFPRAVNFFSHFKKNTDIFLILGSASLFVLWMCCLPRSAYPGKITHHMGDIPEYYVLAENIYNGNGFVTDYFIGDFWQGPRQSLDDIIASPPIAARRPLVPFVTSLFYYLTGVSHQVINIAAAFFAALLPLAFYDFFRRFAGHKGIFFTEKKKRGHQIAALAVCLIPSHFILSALGTITVFEMTPFFVLMTLLLFRSYQSHLESAVLALSGGVVLVSRPEGIILVVLAAVLFLLPDSLKLFLRQSHRKELQTMLIFFMGTGLISFPAIFTDYGPGSSSQNTWYKTLRYSAETGNFDSLYPRWQEFNSAIIRENFAEQPDIQNTLNTKIHSEIVSHPLAFVKWMIFQSWQKLRALSNLYVMDTFWLTAILVILVFIGFELRFPVLLLLFTFGFSLLSPIMYARQAIVFSPMILISVYSGFFRLSVKLFPSKSGFLSRGRPAVFREVISVMAVLSIVLLAVWNTASVIQIHRNPRNNEYNASLELVAKYTEPQDIIVSDYPQLINLMTGRISLGASDLLQILNPLLERFHPDYVLVTDSRDHKSSSALLQETDSQAAAYVTQNYELLETDQRGNTLLFKHK